jgi:uncharacterized protein (UPF0264 family)
VTKLLVSVRSRAEAELALAAGVDLIDAKEPRAGSLGVLPVSVVRAIVEAAGSQAPTSAVAGEGAPDELCNVVRDLAATGATFVKVGLAHRALAAPGLARLVAAAGGTALVAVLAAEDGMVVHHVETLRRAGFRGAMIDTREKRGGGLRDRLRPDELAAFVSACRKEGLLTGLAGSLSLADVAPLAALRPDYLGFRGGVCVGDDRTARLDGGRIALARQALAASAPRARGVDIGKVPA